MALYSPGRRRAIILLVLTSVLLLTIDLRGNAIIDGLRSAWNQALRPFESAAEVVARPVRNAWRGITDYDDLRAENQRLRERNRSQEAAYITARSLLAELDQLYRVEDLESASDYDLVTASVQGASPSNVDQVVDIDKGSDDGLRVGMPVVTSENVLIGKITSVTTDRARVMLVTDDRYAIGVKIVRPADELPEAQFPTTTSTTTTTTTTTTVPDSLVDGSAPAVDLTIALTTTTSTSTTTTTVPAGSAPPGASTTTTPATTTTTTTPDPQRETGSLEGQGPSQLPEIRFVDDSPAFGRPVAGDAVMTAGGSNGLAPPNLLVGVVDEVVPISPSEGLRLLVRPFADVDDLDFVHVILYQPESEAQGDDGAD